MNQSINQSINHLLLKMYSTENKMLMSRNTMWAGQKGLKALTAALKMKINLLKKWYKNKIQIHNTTNWQRQTIGLQGTWKINWTIDRLKLVREVKSTALDGKLFQISITRSDKNDDLAVHEQWRLKILCHNIYPLHYMYAHAPPCIRVKIVTKIREFHIIISSKSRIKTKTIFYVFYKHIVVHIVTMNVRSVTNRLNTRCEMLTLNCMSICVTAWYGVAHWVISREYYAYWVCNVNCHTDKMPISNTLFQANNCFCFKIWVFVLKVT